MNLTGYLDDTLLVWHADHLTDRPLGSLGENTVDAVVTDPPYELGFMGKKWDGTGIAYDVAFWESVYRALKPGGHLLSFGGSRTWHRLSCAVEDAGFEIRDSIAWLYGSGFPKSLDVSKAIDKAAGAERTEGAREWSGGQRRAGVMGENLGTQTLTKFDTPATEAAQQWQGWGTALKPAFEPIVVGRKPFPGTVAVNVQEHGTGALNIDGCRVGSGDDGTSGGATGKRVSADEGYMGSWSDAEDGRARPTGGRWPTNVVLDESQAAELDAQTAGTRAAKAAGSGSGGSRLGYHGGASADSVIAAYDDQGGASRFFPVFKYQAKAPAKERPKVDGVAHPTVKPLELMRWLVRLVTPPGGLVLDPFAGSGTTGEACLLEGFRCLLVEREADYLPLIDQRLNKHVTKAS